MQRQVREIALRASITVHPEMKISDVEQLLFSHNASEIYVVDHEDMLLGVVRDNEVLQYRMLGGDGCGRAAALMSPVSVTLSATDSLEHAARIMREQEHSSLPVIQQGRLIGQLCRRSLLRIFTDFVSSGATELSLPVSNLSLNTSFASGNPGAWSVSANFMQGSLRGAG